MRAVFAWELGNSFGHITQILDAAESLSSQGWEIFFALKSPVAAAGFEKDFGYKILQAPYQPPQPISKETLTYAEDLIGCGYENAQGLAMLVQCWRDMFDLIQPDAIIAQAAPTALLAGKTCGIKTFSFGSGYDVPPNTRPMTPLRYWHSYPPGFIENRETAMLDNINEALKILGLPPFESVAKAVEGDKTFLCTFPELDHYPSSLRDDDKVDYYGPFFKTDAGKKYEWRKGKYKRIFVYIHPHLNSFNECIHGLRNLSSEYDIILVSPNVTADFIKKVEKENFRVSNEIIKLDNLLSKCDLAVTHASQGISSAFIMHGIPLIMLPGHIEQLMFAHTVANWSGGKIADEPYSAKNIEEKIQSVLVDKDINAATKKMARKYKNYNTKKQAQKIVKEIRDAVC